MSRVAASDSGERAERRRQAVGDDLTQEARVRSDSSGRRPTITQTSRPLHPWQETGPASAWTADRTSAGHRTAAATARGKRRSPSTNRDRPGSPEPTRRLARPPARRVKSGAVKPARWRSTRRGRCSVPASAASRRRNAWGISRQGRAHLGRTLLFGTKGSASPSNSSRMCESAQRTASPIPSGPAGGVHGRFAAR